MAVGVGTLRPCVPVLLCCLLPVVHRASAQATPPVPLRELVYRDIDVLGAAGLLDSLIVGERPYSRREIVRLLREAQTNLGRRGDSAGWAARAIAEDLQRYADTPLKVVESVSADAAYLDSPARGVPADSNGRVDAEINPLAAYRQGRRLYDGGTTAFESRHALALDRHVVLSLEPRVSVAARRATNGASSLSVRSGEMSLLFAKIAIGIGRENIVFGQAPSGGLVLSNNAPALDVIRVSTDRPFTLPWLFRLLGPLRGTAFIADLGPHQNFPHAKLIGYKLSGVIHPQFELGAQVIDEMSGSGSPPGLLRDRLYDLVPLIDIFNTRTDYLFSNKFAGIDFRWRLPRLYGFELFGEGALDDLDARRWKSSFLEDGGYIGGFSFSCLVECGTLRLHGEYHQTGIRYYTHYQFTTGIAENRFLLGDPLGPRGLGAYVTVDRAERRLGVFSVVAAHEVRSGNRYASVASGAEQRDFHFVQIERHPGETRTRLSGNWAGAPWTSSVLARLSAGIERVTNFDFVAGADRTNVLAQLTVEYRP